MTESSFGPLQKYILLFMNEVLQRYINVKIPRDNILNYGFPEISSVFRNFLYALLKTVARSLLFPQKSEVRFTCFSICYCRLICPEWGYKGKMHHIVWLVIWFLFLDGKCTLCNFKGIGWVALHHNWQQNYSHFLISSLLVSILHIPL